MKANKLLPALVLGLSGLVMLVYLLPGLALLRPFVMLAFMVAGPGLGWLPLLKLSGPTRLFTLGVALSLGLDTLVALVFLYAGAWSVDWMLVVLLVIAVCGALYQMLGLANPGYRAGPD